jgi:predicted transposase/invertase (TIGR01784 family)
MRRDTIFYKLFQQSPSLLFELLTNPPKNASAYRFDSVAVKEPKFEIDGVFLPPAEASAGVVYFCEVQFYKDEQLYERLFAESSLYFYRNRARFSDWQAVIIYPSRSFEQSDIHPHRTFLNGNQVHRVYLNELGNIRELPLWVALMVLTTVEEDKAPEEARYLLQRNQQETTQQSSQTIIELITTIIAYKFQKLNKREVEQMLGITFEQTRFYQDIEQTGLEKGERRLILRLLTRRVGELSLKVREQIETLSLEQLENLGDALLNFSSMNDLHAWLDAVE